MDKLFDLARRLWGLIQRGWNWLRSLFERVIQFITGRPDQPSEGQAELPAQTAQPRPAVQAAPTSSPTLPTATAEDPEATDDETALARMLASEDQSQPAKIVIGWIAVQKQRARKTTMYNLLTKGRGYGPQDRTASGGGAMYASTAKKPTPPDRKLARGLLDRSVMPSAAIRAHKPGGWVERGQGVSDEKILNKQKDWNEGIYASIAGTKWVLFSSDTKPISVPKDSTATQVLDALPTVPAVDNRDDRAVA